MTETELREAARKAAMSFVGVGAQTQKDRYLAIVAPNESREMREFLAKPNDARASGCGLVNTAVMRALRIKHPKIDAALTPGYAIERNIQVARQAGAWVDYALGRFPKVGDQPYLFRGPRWEGDTTSQHTYTITSVTDSGVIHSVDGGQVDRQGYQTIETKTRVWKNGVDLDRPVRGWIDMWRLWQKFGGPLTPEVTTVEGIDVASVNGEIDWDKVATEVSFAYLRCMIGRDDVDGRLAANVAGCKKAGLPFGLYGVSFPRSLPRLQDAHIQAVQLSSHTIGHGAQLQPMIDAEVRNKTTNKDIADAAYLYAKTLRSHGYDPLLYTYPAFWREVARTEDVSWALDTRLWIAHYAPEKPGVVPDIPPPWKHPLLWQYAASQGVIGHVSGVATAVDRNRLYAPLDAIRIPKGRP